MVREHIRVMVLKDGNSGFKGQIITIYSARLGSWSFGKWKKTNNINNMGQVQYCLSLVSKCSKLKHKSYSLDNIQVLHKITMCYIISGWNLGSWSQFNNGKQAATNRIQRCAIVWYAHSIGLNSETRPSLLLLKSLSQVSP